MESEFAAFEPVMETTRSRRCGEPVESLVQRDLQALTAGVLDVAGVARGRCLDAP
jgi:hypothetical protein